MKLNNSPEIIARRQLESHNDNVLKNQETHAQSTEVLDHDKLSEMRKLVHELDNNLSISSQQSSSLSSKEEKCDACIHTQPISPIDG